VFYKVNDAHPEFPKLNGFKVGIILVDGGVEIVN